MSELFISRYHPAIESSENLKKLFVGKQRIELCALIIKELQTLKQDDFPQHHLFYGPQGIGKTHLLWNIFYAIKEDTLLTNKWLPVILPEELFSAHSTTDILQIAIKEISRQSQRTLADENISSLAELMLKKIENTKNKKEKFNKCVSALKQIFEKEKIVLLMIENLDHIFKDMAEKDKQDFFSLINRSNFLMIIATSVSIFEDLQKYNSPVYGYFRLHSLELLNTDEIFELLTKITEFYSKEYKCLTEFFNTPFGMKRKRLIQAIVFLSGGIPRMIYPLYEIGMAECGKNIQDKEKETFKNESISLMSELFEKLTEIYKERLWSLSAKERRVLEFIAIADSSSQPKNIASGTDIVTNELSTYLKRLLEKKYIRSAKVTKGREQFYIPTEPLLGLWLKWRKGASIDEKWSFIADFFAILFTKDELEQRVNEIPEEDMFYSLYCKAKERISVFEKRMQEAELTSFEPERFMKKEKSGDEEDWNEKGNELFDLGKYEESIDCYNKVIEINLNDDNAWYNKGCVLNKLGKYEESIDCYNKVIEINPNDDSAWNNKGIALCNLGKYEEAIECCNKVIEINPNDDNAWYIKGIILGCLGKYEEEISCYNKVIEINSNNENVWNNKGVALGNLEKHEEAIECYDKAIELNPNDDKAWYNKGIALGNLGKYEEAINCYDKVIELNPNNCSAWGNKGIVLGNFGKYEEEINCYNKVIELHPNDDKAWYNKGIALGNLGKYEEAINCYNKATELNPNNANAWNDKGIALDYLEKHEEANECYKKAIELNPYFFLPHLLNNQTSSRLISILSKLDLEKNNALYLPIIFKNLDHKKNEKITKNIENNNLKKNILYLYLLSNNLLYNLLVDNKQIAGEILDKILTESKKFPEEMLVEILALILQELIIKKESKAVVQLESLLDKEENKKIVKILSPYFISGRIYKNIIDGNINSGLKELERLESSQREFVISLLTPLLGKNWITEAQKKL